MRDTCELSGEGVYFFESSEFFSFGHVDSCSFFAERGIDRCGSEELTEFIHIYNREEIQFASLLFFSFYLYSCSASYFPCIVRDSSEFMKRFWAIQACGKQLYMKFMMSPVHVVI